MCVAHAGFGRVCHIALSLKYVLYNGACAGSSRRFRPITVRHPSPQKARRLEGVLFILPNGGFGYGEGSPSARKFQCAVSSGVWGFFQNNPWRFKETAKDISHTTTTPSGEAGRCPGPSTRAGRGRGVSGSRFCLNTRLPSTLARWRALQVDRRWERKRVKKELNNAQSQQVTWSFLSCAWLGLAWWLRPCLAGGWPWLAGGLPAKARLGPGRRHKAALAGWLAPSPPGPAWAWRAPAPTQHTRTNSQNSRPLTSMR